MSATSITRGQNVTHLNGTVLGVVSYDAFPTGLTRIEAKCSNWPCLTGKTD